jgi:hypothetical protein
MKRRKIDHYLCRGRANNVVIYYLLQNRDQEPMLLATASFETRNY